jgi:predicted dehydrogenase
LILRLADSELTADATGLASVSMTEGPSYQNRIELYGSKGTMRIDHRGELFVAKTGEDDWTAVPVGLGRLIEGMPDTGFARGFMEFAPLIVEAVRDGRNTIEHAATFADGLEVQRVLDAARESDREGRAVRVHR